mgnify:CR=1 FL=1
MTTYTLSIEDRVGRGVDCTERAVIVYGNDNGFREECTYNPTKKTELFDYDGPFDTSFSIVHPMRNLANEIAVLARASSKPEMKYHSSVNDVQRTLFGNILVQEFAKATTCPKDDEVNR